MMPASQAVKRVTGFLAVLCSFVLCMICYFAGATSSFVPQADFFHIGPPNMVDTFIVTPGALRVHARHLPVHTNDLDFSNLTVRAEPIVIADGRLVYIYLWKNCYTDIRSMVTNCTDFSAKWDYNLMVAVAEVTPAQLQLSNEVLGVENTLTANFVFVTYTCVLGLTGMAVLLQAVYSFTDGLLLILLADLVASFLFLFAANCGFTFIMNNGVSVINRLAEENKVNIQAYHGKLWLTMTWVSTGILFLSIIFVAIKKPWKKEEAPPADFPPPMEGPPPPMI